jgi:hypothetical protein
VLEDLISSLEHLPKFAAETEPVVFICYMEGAALLEVFGGLHFRPLEPGSSDVEEAGTHKIDCNAMLLLLSKVRQVKSL